MCLLREAEAAGAAVRLSRWKHGLKVLTLVLWHAGIAEAADLGMFSQYAEQGRSAAPVKPAKEDEFVAIRLDHERDSWRGE